jgi:hypothetical protein
LVDFHGVYRKDNVESAPDWNEYLARPIQMANYEDQFQSTSESLSNFYPIITSSDFLQVCTTKSVVDNQFLSFQKSTDIFPLTPINVKSTQSQTDELLDVHEDNRKQQLVSNFCFTRNIRCVDMVQRKNVEKIR